MKTKKLIGLIAICVLGAISLGSFFGLARTTINDIAGFDFKTVNEANYFNVSSYETDMTTGGPVSADDDGLIKVEWDEDFVQSSSMNLNIQKITLEPGEYVFKSGVKNTSQGTYCLVLRETTETGTPVADDIIVADTSFTVKQTTHYMACIYIAENQTCTATFAPVLVEKGEKTKFFVYDFNIFDNED